MTQQPTTTEENIKESPLAKPRRSRKKSAENTSPDADQHALESNTEVKKSSRKKKANSESSLTELSPVRETADISQEQQNTPEPEKKRRRTVKKAASEDKFSAKTSPASEAPVADDTVKDKPATKTRRPRSRKTADAASADADKKNSSTASEAALPRNRSKSKPASAESSQDIIHLGSALVLDDMLPPSSSLLTDGGENKADESVSVRRTQRSRKSDSASRSTKNSSPEETAVPSESSPKETSPAHTAEAEVPVSLTADMPGVNHHEAAEEEIIHLGSALILDDILPPSRTEHTERQRGDQRRKEYKDRNSRMQEKRQKPQTKQTQAAPGNQASAVTPPVDDDFGNRADNTAAENQLWTEDDSIVTHILPYAGEFNDDIRSHRRTRRNKKSRDLQPAFNGSPYLPAPYQKNFYDQPQSLVSTPAFNNRKQRNNRHKTPRNPQPVPTLTDDFDFNAAMLNDSILGVAFGKREDDFIPEDDGPQPALPDQPIALPPSSGDMEEEDLEALDAAVNGNRMDSALSANAKEHRQNHRNKKGFKEEKIREDKSPSEKNTPAENSTEEETPRARRVLYISVIPDEQVEVVITEDGQVTEYFVEMAHQVKIRGNIYKGIINNIDTNLQAAFVNFGNGKNGFLQIDEVHPEYYLVPHDASHGPKYPPIQKVLKVGQEVLVQVVKEPAGSKGAFLTTWISIAGRFLVLTPGQEQIGVSRKVEDPEERSRLKDLLNGIQPGENMGVIIRTASEGASKTSIQQDLQYLKKLWKDIQKKAPAEKAPCLIYQEADLATRSVRDYLSEDIVEIWTDDEAVKPRIEDIVRLIFPERASELVKLHKDQRQTLWERFNLLRQLETVTSREVVLPSGGRLVFDQTEALMAIDINSGKTQGKTNFEAMVFRTNMEAAEAIARHLRLRDIGGQVVIDFIEMRDKNHCREVERTIRNAMRRDRARHDIGHMSSFGLLELVRQRTGTSAISISCEPCPHCHGTGVRRNMEWQALQTLRDLQSKLCKSLDSSKKKNDQKSSDTSTFAYECDVELAMYILNRKRDRLTALEEKYGVRIEVRLK